MLEFGAITKKLSGNINVVHVFKTNNLNEVEKICE